MTLDTSTEPSIDDVDFSGIQRIHIRDLTHPQKGWEMIANDVSVWAEIEHGNLNIFITDPPSGRVYAPDSDEVTHTD